MDTADLHPKRILVLQQRQIGDVILVTPALEALRRRFPDAEIHFCTEKACAQLIYGNPHVDKIIELDKKALKPVTREFAWYWRTARNGYDLVIDFQQLPRCRWLTAFTGAKVRFAAKYRWYNRLIYNVFADPHEHDYSAWNKVNALSVFGIENEHDLPKIYLTAEERAQARRLLAEWGVKEGDTLVTLDVTHRRATCKWPPEHFARAVELMLAQEASLRFLLFFGPGEEQEARAVYERLSPEARSSVILLPETQPIRIIAACIAEAAMHFGNCSAPQHMAAAVGTPSCIILGAVDRYWRCPTDDHVCVDLGLPCQPCLSNECSRDIACLKGLLPETVAQAALTLLRKVKDRAD